MTVTKDDFEKVWASTSPLTPYAFSDSQYKEGWNFIGSTPPSRQMWDFLQKNNDEKMQYLLTHFDNYLPLSGGTLTGVVNGVTPPNGDNSKKLANTEFIQALASILVPIGVVQAFAGNTVPDGWLLCDGSAVSRTDYAELYAVIGDTYGAGDGTSTFNLPDLIDKFVQGNATAGTVKSAGLPNITGSLTIRSADGFDVFVNSFTPATSALYGNVLETWAGAHSVLQSVTADPASVQQVNLSAQRNNAIYGNSNTVQPPALTMRYVIKY